MDLTIGEMLILQNDLEKIEKNKKSAIVQTRVISSFKSTLQQVYNKELPLDHIIFLYAAAAGFLMSLFGIGYNIWRGLGVFMLPVFVVSKW